MDIEDYIMDQPHVMPRLNARVLQADPQYLDLTFQSGGCATCEEGGGGFLEVFSCNLISESN